MIILEDEREDYSESNTHASKYKKVPNQSKSKIFDEEDDVDLVQGRKKRQSSDLNYRQKQVNEC